MDHTPEDIAKTRGRTHKAVNLGSENADANGSRRGRSSDSQGRQAPLMSLLAALLDMVVRFIGARIPGMVKEAKDRASAFLHPHGGEDALEIPQRIVETGERVIAWGKRHPRHAIAAGTAVVAIAVIIGYALHAHRDNAEPERRSKGRKSKARRAGSAL